MEDRSYLNREIDPRIKPFLNSETGKDGRFFLKGEGEEDDEESKLYLSYTFGFSLNNKNDENTPKEILTEVLEKSFKGYSKIKVEYSWSINGKLDEPPFLIGMFLIYKTEERHLETNELELRKVLNIHGRHFYKQ